MVKKVKFHKNGLLAENKVHQLHQVILPCSPALPFKYTCVPCTLCALPCPLLPCLSALSMTIISLIQIRWLLQITFSYQPISVSTIDFSLYPISLPYYPTLAYCPIIDLYTCALHNICPSLPSPALLVCPVHTQ